MNAKTCKKLRKEAKQLSALNGLPYAEYQKQEYRKVMFDLTGKPIQYVVYTAMLVNDCYKKLYKQLKQVEKD